MMKLFNPTFISETSLFQGDLLLSSHTKIFGKVKGNIIQQESEPLQITKTGVVEGNIQAEGPIIIEGKVTGSITSKTKIKLSASSQVQACLISPKIEIDRGAFFEGQTSMKTLTQQTALKRAA